MQHHVTPMIRQFTIRQLRNCQVRRNVFESRSISHYSNLRKVQNTRKRFRFSALFNALLGGAASYLVDEYYFESLIQRSVRAISTLSWVAYKYSSLSNAADIQAYHEEAAASIFSMLAKNKGLYIKLGQAVANQGSVFPVAYQRHFVNLYDAAPVDQWKDIDKLLRHSLGPNYEKEVFEYIEHNPVASALIAQVHKAKLRESGEEVAVKIQHPYIAAQVPIDLRVYRFMSRVYSKVFDIPLSYITGYIADQLIKEMDFTIEAVNCKRLALYIENDPITDNLDIYVPKTYDELSSRKVLVSEWIDGLSLARKQKLIDAKFSLSRAMNQYITIFARQIFEYGFVHSDPHPGNLLARKLNGCQQLVILDHGLYVDLPEKFKNEYQELWQAMINLDLSIINKVAEDWGVGSSEFLKAMVQLKPPATTKSKVPNSLDLMREFFSDETKFPPDLLFVMRTMRMIQNLNQSVGSPVNRINILTKSAIYLINEKRSFKLLEWLSAIKIKLTILLSDCVFWYFRARQVLLGDQYGGKGEGIEDFIEQRIREGARSMGIEIVEGM